jgi:hypothetical protein
LNEPDANFTIFWSTAAAYEEYMESIEPNFTGETSSEQTLAVTKLQSLSALATQ